jgi:hypothetical protein
MDGSLSDTVVVGKCGKTKQPRNVQISVENSL